MRMWMINPELLCDKHLLGEHGELHKFRLTFVKKFSITGRIYPVVQIEPKSMWLRHEALAVEIIRRDMNHDSEFSMPDITYLPPAQREAIVDPVKSIMDLIERCPECERRVRYGF